MSASATGPGCRDAQLRHAGRRPLRRHDQRPGGSGHTPAHHRPGARPCPPVTRHFEPHRRPDHQRQHHALVQHRRPGRQRRQRLPIFGGDLINLGNSLLDASLSGSITFVSNPTTAGDYRLFLTATSAPSTGKLHLARRRRRDLHALDGGGQRLHRPGRRRGGVQRRDLELQRQWKLDGSRNWSPRRFPTAAR